MTKADIIEWVAQRSDIPKKQAEMVVNTVLLSIVEALDAGEKVELRGFGSFHMKKREARVARNPKTGEKVHVDEKTIPYFRAGKELKELINK